ncbi:MAG TPA: 4Fe-4S binding protein [bacterium]|nr:4Fe-4S binding protein [bacterium]
MDDYEKLREVLDKHLSGAPPAKAIDEILRILFTPEEAKVALGLIFAPSPVAEIAAAAGVSEEEARLKCESMADKGIVYCRDKGGEKGYALLPTIPGLFEFPFMKGGGTPEHEKLGRLWEIYHREGMGDSFAGSATPLTRVIPIERAVDARTEVLPFEAISKMLARNDTFALAQCACRVSVGACDKPRDVCLIFDKTGRFLIERGYAKEITREEALEVVRRAEEAGLVHTTNNSQDRLTLICNCCPCCCTILRGLTELENPNAFAVSRWHASVDAEECNACGVCEDERCPVGAIRVGASVAEVDEKRCIGCGLCSTTCEALAITMVPRPEAAEPAKTVAELGMKIMGEKGKLTEFLKMMKR